MAFGHGWIVGDNTSAEDQKASQVQADLGKKWALQSKTLVTTSLSELWPMSWRIILGWMLLDVSNRYFYRWSMMVYRCL